MTQIPTPTRVRIALLATMLVVTAGVTQMLGQVPAQPPPPFTPSNAVPVTPVPVTPPATASSITPSPGSIDDRLKRVEERVNLALAIKDERIQSISDRSENIFKLFQLIGIITGAALVFFSLRDIVLRSRD